jgi:hypothetical protein
VNCACGSPLPEKPWTVYRVAYANFDSNGEVDFDSLELGKKEEYCGSICPQIHEAHKRAVAATGEFCGCSRCIEG